MLWAIYLLGALSGLIGSRALTVMARGGVEQRNLVAIILAGFGMLSTFAILIAGFWVFSWYMPVATFILLSVITAFTVTQRSLAPLFVMKPVFDIIAIGCATAFIYLAILQG
ncbi:hypothetical protein CVO77_04345 [Sphingopyxis lindanitolerans]|uniref:Uncharacterized protein n=1 Tax=Sphingopyxis lindanitolerans TaxID=2054227 RepID=A0A2S8B632_9SPHN|nr:hypothetical protein [Sphingopyxis lindanitolerans]PQM27800.1 hypothetical protein CVO77_04345 [Sphingopyxis lindanitolerans]